MEKFCLEEPSINRKEEVLEFLNEFVEYNSEINGTGSIDKCLEGLTYEECLLEQKKRNNKEYAYSINRCPSKTFFFIRENDNKLIGMINVRYEITKEFLDNGATHIGYCIRPTERQKGYNKIQLYLGLLELQRLNEKEAYLDCTTKNIGSNKSIISLGGILLKTYLDPYDNEMSNYYLIDVNKSIKEYKNLYEKIIKI